jgi:hypothetical protein
MRSHSSVSEPAAVNGSPPSPFQSATPVSSEKFPSPQEIERICRCFIRLINAAEEIINAELSTTTDTTTH